nr:class I SAM-dependent methyltransferase [Brevibacterium daeguense]
MGAFSSATGRELDGGVDKPRYRRYQYDLIAPHCGRSVLEVGAGLGEFSAQFTDRDRLVVTDVDPDAVEVMCERFAGRPDVDVMVLDAGGPVSIDEPVDTLVAINVLEHFEDDSGTLSRLAGLVRPGGTVVLWVPGYQQLYGDFDAAVGHFRRYSPTSLAEAIGRAGLDLELAKPVNLLGGIAWWLAVRKGRSSSPGGRLVSLYDRFVVPVTRTVERLVPVPFGQSVLGVARVPAARVPGDATDR